MNELPHGWTLTTLAEITQNVPNVRPEQNPTLEFGYVDISSVDNRNYHIATIKKFKGKDAPSRAKRPVQLNDVLFSNVRTYLRNVAMVSAQSEAQVCSTGFTVLRPNDAVDPRYLFRWVLTDHFIDKVTPKQTGTHYPATSDRIIRSEKIPLPPLNEQRRIVAKLDTLLSRVDAAGERLAAIPRLLRRFRQSVLTAACSGHLSADWRGYSIDLSRSTPPVTIGPPERDDSRLGWKWRLLTDLARLESGHTPRKTVPEYWKGGKVSWISLQDIREAHGKVLDETKLMPTELGISNSSARMLPPGTVVFSRDISVGYVTIMGREMATSQHFANWLCGSEINNRYLMYALMASKDSLVSSGQGSTVRTIYMPALESMHIRLPKIEEQLEIVRRVHNLFKTADALEARYRNANAHVNKLPQSILAKAFRGELVPQDPHDEPASVLLEHVRQQRNGSIVTKVRSNTKRSGR